MARDDDNTIRLATGKSFYAHNRLVGINDDLAVCEGYDGHINGLRSIEDSDPDTIQGQIDREQAFTAEDRVALADRMIALWQRFKASR